MKQESPTGSAGDFFVYYFIRDFYLQVTNNLIDVLFRDILQFLLIINGKEVDTGVRALERYRLAKRSTCLRNSSV